MVILKYKLTEVEYFDFNYFTGWAAPEKRSYRIRYVVRAIITYTIFAAIYLFAIRRDFSLVSILIFSIPGLIFFLLIPTLVKRGIRRQVRTLLEKPENAKVLDPGEVMVMDTGILIKDNTSEAKYNWDAIVRKAETLTAWYLYTNSYFAIVIPKRVVVKAEERQELNRLFNQHLSLSTEFSGR